MYLPNAIVISCLSEYTCRPKYKEGNDIGLLHVKYTYMMYAIVFLGVLLFTIKMLVTFVTQCTPTNATIYTNTLHTILMHAF